MAQVDNNESDELDDSPADPLDAFLNAKDPAVLKKAAATVAKNTIYRVNPKAVEQNNVPNAGASSGDPESGTTRRVTRVITAAGERSAALPAGEGGVDGKDGGEIPSADELANKFIAVDPTLFQQEQGEAPFVLIPAHVNSYIPRWGWVALGLGLAMLVAGVVFTPMFSLNRLAARLGDENEANAQYAMRRLIVSGNERTVRKLYDMASAPDEALRTRLRAVDAMTLMERIPEVDRALLRLELSEDIDARVREAAVAARRQRDAVQARQRFMGKGGE